MSVHEWNQLALGLALKKFRVAEHNGQILFRKTISLLVKVNRDKVPVLALPQSVI